METTTHEQLKIISPFSISHILNMNINVIPNEHATLHMRCILDSENFSLDTISKSYENEKIEVLHTESGEKIFSGIIENFSSSFTNEYYEIEFYAISGSILLDLKKKSKSFQDIHLLYYYLIRQILKETPKASYIAGDEWNKPIELPIIQYNETDWEFIKRLASHFNTSVVPEITKGAPKFYFGMPKGKNRGKVDASEYQVGVRDKYWSIGGEHLGFNKTDFLYYKISSDQNFQIGDDVSFLNFDLKICEKYVELKKDILVFYYVLSKNTFISEHTLYNDQISGSTIWGTVLETNQETLKVHLDIDKTQDIATAYPYEWAPETGDLFYMMPQVGTRVGLYFYNADERSGKTVRCIRTNGGKENSTILMDDYEKRILWTEHNKKMLLYPEELTFFGVSENPEKPLMMSLKDDEGIAFNTEYSIQMIANKEIQFEAPMVCLSSLAGSTFAKLTYTAEDMLEQLAPDFEKAKSYILAIDSEGKEYLAATSKGTVYYAGQVFRECEKIDDAPKEGKFEWGKWIGNIIAGIVTVVVVTAAVAALVATGVLTGGATLVATVAVVGTFTVGANSYSDLKSGNVRDTSDMILSVGGTMIFAAVAGGVLPKIPIIGKFISTPFAQTLGKVLSNPATIGAVTSLISGGKQLIETGDFKPRSTIEQGVQAGVTAYVMQESIKSLTPAADKLVNTIGNQIRKNPALEKAVFEFNEKSFYKNSKPSNSTELSTNVNNSNSKQITKDDFVLSSDGKTATYKETFTGSNGEKYNFSINEKGQLIETITVNGQPYSRVTQVMPNYGPSMAANGNELATIGGNALSTTGGSLTIGGNNFPSISPSVFSNPNIFLAPAYAAYLANAFAPTGSSLSIPSNIATGGFTGGGYVGPTLSSPIKRPVLGIPPASGNGGGTPPSSGNGKNLNNSNGSTLSKQHKKYLRSKSPSQKNRDDVNAIEGIKKDPIYGYPVEKFEADHIVPFNEIVDMPGFSTLTLEQQLEVVNLPENMMGLGKSTNASKQAKSWEEWNGHSQLGPIKPEIKKQMIEKSQAAKKAIEEKIKEFSNLNNQSKGE